MASVSDILTTLQQGTVAINNLVIQTKGSLNNIAGQLAAFRQPLLADTTYFVRTDGNDGNNGLSNTAAGAFLTIPHALTVAAALDCSTFQLTISVQAGTFSAQLSLPRMLASKAPVLTGVGSTTIISTVGDPITNDGGTPWQVNSMKLTATGNVGLLVTRNSGIIRFSGIEFGASSNYQIFTYTLSSIQGTGAYSVSGGGAAHANATGFIDIANLTITITSAAAYTDAFAETNVGGYLRAFANTFTNSSNVTGSRYLSQNNGIIFTNGGSSTYFPGTVTGSVSNGGLYI